jgi:hypothetical protein
VDIVVQGGDGHAERAGKIAEFEGAFGVGIEGAAEELLVAEHGSTFRIG